MKKLFFTFRLIKMQVLGSSWPESSLSLQVIFFSTFWISLLHVVLFSVLGKLNTGLVQGCAFFSLIYIFTLLRPSDNGLPVFNIPVFHIFWLNVFSKLLICSCHASGLKFSKSGCFVILILFTYPILPALCCHLSPVPLPPSWVFVPAVLKSSQFHECTISSVPLILPPNLSWVPVPFSSAG